VRGVEALDRSIMKSALDTRTLGATDTPRQRILDEIAEIERELRQRQSFGRPAPASVVRAYHALLDRHYQQLEALMVDKS